MKTAVAAIALVSLFALSIPAEAGTPLDTVQSAVDAAITVLTNPDLRGPAHAAERTALLQRVADHLFDFNDMARRALGYHSAAPSDTERVQFVRLFTDLLERSYLKTIDNYADEKIVYLGEAITDGHYATVRTKIVTTRRAEVPVDYRLRRSANGWAVFDVALENVSLVANYRQQFDRILRTTSFATLLDRLRRREVAAVTIPAGAGRSD